MLGYLQAEGYRTASSDAIARELFNSPAIQGAIAEILGTSAPVAPAALREALVDPEIRRSVNSITHPKILQAIRTDSAQFFEVPLLIETCLQEEFDRVWVVTCGPEEQLRRLTARLGDADSAESIIRTQLTSRAKIPFADRVLRTNQRESTVQRCVTAAAQRDLG